MVSMYLGEHARATSYEMSYALGVSRLFLDQVLGLLRKGGIVTSVRGPGGGYMLRDDADLSGVIAALQPIELLTVDDMAESRTSGVFQKRALAYFAVSIKHQVQKVANKNIKKLVFDLKQNEIESNAAIRANKEYNWYEHY